MRIWLNNQYNCSNIVDVCVVGAGAAGMAAAHAAAKEGARVLLVEREACPGGILPQCVHDGFGVFSVGKSLTGPAYAQTLWEKLDKCDIDVLLSCDVCSLSYASPSEINSSECCAQVVRVALRGAAVGGEGYIYARQLVLATGCYEKPASSLGIVGTRPAGVMTAGAAQRLMNVDGMLPGKNVVILGTGDIAAIVARRLKLEGANVVAMIGAQITCLHRNYVQCIREFNIPLRVPWTVLSVEGSARVQAVTIAPLDEQGKPDISRKEEIACDTLLLAAGLKPRTEVLDALLCCDKQAQNALETPLIQLAGNASTIHALVDAAVVEGVQAGITAAKRALDARGDSRPKQTKKSVFLPHVSEENLARGASVCPTDSSKHYTCSMCPKSCTGTYHENEDGSFTCAGFECEKGKAQAQELAGTAHELFAFTGTVLLENEGGLYHLPVHSSAVFSQKQIMLVAQEAKKLCVQGSYACGQTVVSNIAGLNCTLEASCDSSLLERMGMNGGV